MKKLFKIIAILAAIGGLCAAAYFVVKKFLNDKKNVGNTEENYVSCSCADDDFTSQTVA